MKKTITITFCLLALCWSIWGMWKMSTPSKRIDLGVAEQQKIYSMEKVVYLDNKPLLPCDENIETRICTYSCAPDGLCIFIPSKIMNQYKFNKIK
jgi:hypothetical protein